MSRKGTSSFVLQRASAVLLLPLVVWFLFAVIAHAGDNYADMRVWLARPLTSIPFGALIIVGALHMRIGLMEVILDYVYSWMKDVLLLINWVVSLGLIGLTLWSVYQLSFAG
jgi:succinate dehydrogenase / fumarate reductase membrane anchor subunit